MLVARHASGKVGFAEVMAPKVRWRCFIPSLEGDSRAPTSLRSPTSNAQVCRRHLRREGDCCVIPTVCHGHPVQIFLFSTSLEQVQIRLFIKIFCGERGIRTPETLLEFTRFPGVPLQPLEHLSFSCTQIRLQNYKKYLIYTQKFALFLFFFTIL